MSTGSSPRVISKEVTDAVVALGKLVLQFSRVNRGTYQEDGHTPESDTDHTVMLGIIACSFAKRCLPHLDLGKIAQFALVHDLVEAYAGDTQTLQVMTPYIKMEKEQREHSAFLRIQNEFRMLPWAADTIREYEEKSSPEARYVKALDKAIPKITHILNRGAAYRSSGLTQAHAQEIYDVQRIDMQKYAGDFPEVMELRDYLIEEVFGVVFAK